MFTKGSYKNYNSYFKIHIVKYLIIYLLNETRMVCGDYIWLKIYFILYKIYKSFREISREYFLTRQMRPFDTTLVIMVKIYKISYSQSERFLAKDHANLWVPPTFFIIVQ